MKSILTAALAGLMLLGTVAAVVTPKQSKGTTVAVTSDGGPVACWPGDPDCKPPIPPR